MVAATITLVTLLCGTLVGFLIYRWRRGKPFSIAWALGSFLLAVLFFIVPDFMADRLALIFHGSGDQLIFQQPAKAGVGVDFHVHLRVPSVTATGPIQVELSAPESFGIRTDYKCPASGILKTAGAACGTVASDVFEVDWTLTPKSTSTSDLWISLPPELRPEALYGPNWSAFSQTVPTRPWSSSDDEALWRGQQHVPVRLDANSPKLVSQNYDIDLSRGRLGGRTTVVNTLGVSQNTYAWLALFGTVAASALGSGWLVQLLAWARKKATGQAERLLKPYRTTAAGVTRFAWARDLSPRGVSRARVTRDPFLAAARTDEELDRPRVRFVTITEREDLKRRALL